ncbi:adenylate kinase [Tolypothrix sp. PCC 7910]|uniref:EutP/PduV family microcompartment system protein n=1 Tax=Tolypothrix sp. PCC 7910 TaxID=2099387 RepID=UPI0014279081|nr:EutP/PduV family microcompartment system protein [Tolypothrix sp. PCC 7910]QIR38178.1 adenylate kinase [Tolypothrix sp. PCC 7910]
MQRISIIGTTGSGKTTLAKQISLRRNLPHIELDYLHWESNWIEAPNQIMRERVSQALSANSWVVDGNYSIVRDIVWGKADTVVWLDYSWPMVMSRILQRTIWRVITRQEVCNGNRETWQTTFSRDSIILWALKNYYPQRREYPQLFTKPEYAHLRIVHLRSPADTENWLNKNFAEK